MANETWTRHLKQPVRGYGLNLAIRRRRGASTSTTAPITGATGIYRTTPGGLECVRARDDVVHLIL